MAQYRIAVIDGDGIGPEIVAGAIRVLDAVGAKYGHNFSYRHVLMGGCAIDATGVPLPDETVRVCLDSDSVLLGAVGGPKWDSLPGHLRPEKGLLGIRKALGLYANIRPARLFDALSAACPLRADIAARGIDFVVVRELTGGIYFGERGIRTNAEGFEEAYDTECYSVPEIERIARIAFETAAKRRGKVTSIDKANVLESSRLWRRTVERIAREEYPQIAFETQLVDSAAMQFVHNPSQFDVIVTSNMFGDILSDEAAQITGSLGMLPSSSLGATRLGLYEPIHGSAPDIAGRDVANPIATVLSVAMMLRTSFDLDREAAAVEAAVDSVLRDGIATGDIRWDGARVVGCREMSRLIAERV